MKLSNPNDDVINKLLDYGFGLDLGRYGISKIRTNSACAYVVMANDILITDKNNKAQVDAADEKAMSYMKVIKDLLFTIDTFLWFVKDNSINIPDVLCYAHTGEANGLLEFDKRTISTNCTGGFESVNFTALEISRAIELRQRFFEINQHYTYEDEKYVAITNNKGHPSGKEVVRELNPIERAFDFLRAARGSRNLDAKAAMYMSIFESLLTFESDSLTHRICERIAFYIGKDINERLEIYGNVKIAYDLRSTYIHSLTSEDKLRDKSFRFRILMKIDEYARRLLTKVILIDSKTFLSDEKTLRSFLKELIFKSPAIPFHDIKI